MKSISLKLICLALYSSIFSSAMAAEKIDAAVKKAAVEKVEAGVKKPTAGKGDITLKKNVGGSLELSNLDEDDEAELLIENKEKQKAEAPQATPPVADREIAPRHEEPRELAGRAEPRDQRDALRVENDELVGRAQVRGNEQGGSGYSDDGNVVAGPAGASALATVPKQVSMPSAGDSQNNEIAPNPRPGTDLAVPNTVDMTSTAGQEKYRNLMAQEAARAAASGTQAGVSNPAAVRRYIATDRAAYQRSGN